MRRRISNFFIATMILLIAGFPLLSLIGLSLKTRLAALSTSLLFTPTLDNFRLVFTDRDAAHALANTVAVSCASAIIGLVVGVPSGYWLSRTTVRAKDLSLFSIIALRMLPPIGILLPLYTWFRAVRLLDTKASLILALAATTSVFAAWMMKGFFDQIPVRFEEAALVDGANSRTTLISIVLPLALPGMLLTGLFALVTSWNEFLFALILTSYEGRTLNVLIPSLVTPQGTQWGEIAALSVIATAPVFVVVFAARTFFVRGILYGTIREER